MSISDIIEQFILDSIGNDENVSISRNQLAEHFNCVPSQINYVLSTRFTLDKGYIIESRRGGGGYITIMRMPKDRQNYLSALLENEPMETVTENRAGQILERLEKEGYITEREKNIILSALNGKALLVPDTIKSEVRAHLLKNILVEIMKYNGG